MMTNQNQPDFSPYKDKWLAVVGHHIAAVGQDAKQAYRAAKNARRKDRPILYYIDALGVSHRQHLFIEDWLDQDHLKRIKRFFNANDIEAYLVGGAVRDRLMGKLDTEADLDFVVPKQALATARLLADHLGAAYYAVDADRGVGRVVLPDQNHIDIAAYRGASLYEDLQLRDFTINAIALQISPSPPRLLDPLAGQADLAQKRIRAASRQTFTDDPLRAVRAVRFSQQFDFTLDATTRTDLLASVGDVTSVSAERLRDEMIKLLQVDGPGAAIAELADVGLLGHILPDVVMLQGIQQSLPHRLSVYAHTLQVMNAVPLLTLSDHRMAFLETMQEDLHTYFQKRLAGNIPRLALMPLAALLHDIGKPKTFQQGVDGRIRFWNHAKLGADISGEILSRWRLSDQAQQFVNKIVRHHLRPLLLASQKSVSSRDIYRYLLATEDAAPAIALLSLLDHLGTYPPDKGQAEWERLTQVVYQLCQQYFLPKAPALLTGRDLIDDLNLTPGPSIGVILRAAQEAQAVGEITNREEALAFAARHQAAQIHKAK